MSPACTEDQPSHDTQASTLVIWKKEQWKKSDGLNRFHFNNKEAHSKVFFYFAKLIVVMDSQEMTCTVCVIKSMFVSLHLLPVEILTTWLEWNCKRSKKLVELSGWVHKSLLDVSQQVCSRLRFHSTLEKLLPSEILKWTENHLLMRYIYSAKQMMEETWQLLLNF